MTNIYIKQALFKKLAMNWNLPAKILLGLNTRTAQNP